MKSHRPKPMIVYDGFALAAFASENGFPELEEAIRRRVERNGEVLRLLLDRGGWDLSDECIDFLRREFNTDILAMEVSW